jgi:hypothetical protein
MASRITSEEADDSKKLFKRKQHPLMAERKLDLLWWGSKWRTHDISTEGAARMQISNSLTGLASCPTTHISSRYKALIAIF